MSKTRCQLNLWHPFWVCIRGRETGYHVGPCALVPAWWNLVARWSKR